MIILCYLSHFLPWEFKLNIVLKLANYIKENTNLTFLKHLNHSIFYIVLLDIVYIDTSKTVNKVGNTITCPNITLKYMLPIYAPYIQLKQYSY